MFNKIKIILQNYKFLIGLRIVLGLFFVVSGLAKIVDLSTFGKAIDSYHIVSDNWVVFLSIIIPYVEFVIGMALIINLFPKYTTLSAIILLLIFTAISAYRYFNGDVSDCGCFGKLIERKNDLKLLVENSVLMLFLALQIVLNKKKEN
jgi:uncharacterized membrane protein YphA (DoxX/SURF4 family)